MRYAAPVIVAAVVSILHAQGTIEPPSRFTGPEQSFDIASVKANRSGSEEWRFDTPPGRVVGTNVSLQDLVRYAYSIFGADSDGRILGPEWIRTTRFDIDGRTRPDTSRAAAMSMLRQLLAERFGMKEHYETRQRSAYALVLARSDKQLGPQLKPNAIDCAAYLAAAQADRARGVSHVDPNQPTCGQRFEAGHVVASGLTMADLATSLSGLGRPVIDETGLGTQRFDFELRWTPVTVSAGASTPGGPSIFTALEDQLGVKLVPKNLPMDVLVIDHVQQPSDN